MTMGRPQLIIALMSRFYAIIQSSVRASIFQWKTEQFDRILRFAESIQNIFDVLHEDERIAFLCFNRQTLSSLLFQMPKDISLDEIFRCPFKTLLKVLATNVNLTHQQCEYLINYCSKLNCELDYFASSERYNVETIKQVISNTQQFSTDSICTDSSLTALSSLDFYHVNYQDYSVTMMLSVLLLTANRVELKPTTISILNWLSKAVRMDNSVRVQLASQNDRLIRDLCVILPEFGEVFLQLFDETCPLLPDDRLDSSRLTSTIACLLKADLYLDRIPPVLRTLASQNDSAHTEFWTYVASALQRF